MNSLLSTDHKRCDVKIPNKNQILWTSKVQFQTNEILFSFTPKFSTVLCMNSHYTDHRSCEVNTAPQFSLMQSVSNEPIQVIGYMKTNYEIEELLQLLFPFHFLYFIPHGYIITTTSCIYHELSFKMNSFSLLC